MFTNVVDAVIEKSIYQMQDQDSGNIAHENMRALARNRLSRSLVTPVQIDWK